MLRYLDVKTFESKRICFKSLKMAKQKSVKMAKQKLASVSKEKKSKNVETKILAMSLMIKLG